MKYSVKFLYSFTAQSNINLIVSNPFFFFWFPDSACLLACLLEYLLACGRIIESLFLSISNIALYLALVPFYQLKLCIQI